MKSCFRCTSIVSLGPLIFVCWPSVAARAVRCCQLKQQHLHESQSSAPSRPRTVCLRAFGRVSLGRALAYERCVPCGRKIASRGNQTSNCIHQCSIAALLLPWRLHLSTLVLRFEDPLEVALMLFEIDASGRSNWLCHALLVRERQRWRPVPSDLCFMRVTATFWLTAAFFGRSTLSSPLYVLILFEPRASSLQDSEAPYTKSSLTYTPGLDVFPSAV